MQSIGDFTAENVAIGDERRSLRIALSDGRRMTIPAERLRLHCRCAACARARIDGTFAPDTEGIEIAHVNPIGQYGLNIVFSDGHARGIFPFGYLAELAAFQA